MKLGFQVQSGKFPGMGEEIVPANSASEAVFREERSLINLGTIKPFFLSYFQLIMHN